MKGLVEEDHRGLSKFTNEVSIVLRVTDPRKQANSLKKIKAKQRARACLDLKRRIYAQRREVGNRSWQTFQVLYSRAGFGLNVRQTDRPTDWSRQLPLPGSKYSSKGRIANEDGPGTAKKDQRRYRDLSECFSD